MEAIAIVFHIGSPNVSAGSELAEFVGKARNCVLKILLRKIFSASKDVVSLIIVGSEETENDLADEEHYQNIKVLSPFVIANWELLEEISNTQPTAVDANWLDGIVVGIQCLRDKIEENENYKKIKKNVTKKKLVVLSSFIDDVHEDQVDVVVEGLNDNEVELVVICPEILKVSDGTSDSSTLFDMEKRLTQSQQLILKIYNQVNDKGTICCCDDALEQLKFFKHRRPKRVPWNVNMSIGENLSVHISGYKMLSNYSQSIKWNTSTSSNGPVRRNQSYFFGEDEVDREDVISGYLFGSTIVPFSADDEVALKYSSGEKGLLFLFTVSKDEVPYYLFMGTSPYFIVGHRDDEGAQRAITTIAKSLYESNTVAIVRKVYRYDSNVSIGVLFPKVDSSPTGLVFVELPYKHDIKKLRFPTLSKVSVNEEQLRTVDQLIDDMDLSNYEDEDDDPYHPKNLIDPYEQYLYHCILIRGLQSEEKSFKSEAMEIPEYIQNLILPISDIAKKSRSSIENIKKLFNLKVIERKPSVKSENNDNIVVKEEQDLRPNDEQNGSDFCNLTDIFHSTVNTVGTVNPESDYTTLLARGVLFEKVCEQMQRVIIELLRRADNIDLLTKPLSCLKLLRTSCVERNEANIFNEWMKKLKEIVIDIKQKDIWDKILQDDLGLITMEENNNSNISTETAIEFLKYDTYIKPDIKDEEMDFDKLLDQI